MRLLLTDSCNAYCLGCHNEGQSIKGKFMDFEWLKKFIKQLSTSNIDINEIVLSGGEPTLHPHIEDIIVYIRKYLPNTHLSINTNGLVKDKLCKIYPLVDEVKIHIESNIPDQYESLMGLKYKRMKDVLLNLPDYDKLFICCIARDEQQVDSLINLSLEFKGSSVKFNELTDTFNTEDVNPKNDKGDVYTLEKLSSYLLDKYDYVCVNDNNDNNHLLSPSNNHVVHVRRCIGNTEYIDSNHFLRKGFFGEKVDLYPLVMDCKNDFNPKLMLLFNSNLETEYRWAINQDVFSQLNSKFSPQYEYQFDTVFTFFEEDSYYFRIKNRNGYLSYDIKGRSSHSHMFEEKDLNFKSYDEAFHFGQQIGYLSLKLEKFRSHFTLGESICSIDYVAHLGYFLEIEGPDASFIAYKLGLDISSQSQAYGHYLEHNIKPDSIISSISLSDF